jgi:hypothetical protein
LSIRNLLTTLIVLVDEGAIAGLKDDDEKTAMDKAK